MSLKNENPNAGKKLRVILESPFAGDVDLNLKFGRKCLRDSVLRGEAPIASHLLFTQPGVLDDRVHDERVLGMKAGWAWLPVADLVAVYVDLGISRGMREGVARAREVAIPVAFRRFAGLVSVDVPAEDAEAMLAAVD